MVVESKGVEGYLDGTIVNPTVVKQPTWLSYFLFLFVFFSFGYFTEAWERMSHRCDITG